MYAMNNSNNMNHILEIFWLIVAILTGFMGFFETYTKGIKSSYVFFIMALLSGLLYLARRYLRRSGTEVKK
jgi:hypothetical protein